MKPGRLSYWLAIDDSFMKTIIHYFAFVVFPVLYVFISSAWCRVAVILSTVRYELSSEYVVRHSFSASSWATMNTPIAFTLLIPIVIVVTKCIINLVRYNSIPKHLLLLQFGRVSFFVCGGLSFLLLFLLSTSSIHIEHTLALCPIMIGWLCSIPLMISRIRGVFSDSSLNTSWIVLCIFGIRIVQEKRRIVFSCGRQPCSKRRWFQRWFVMHCVHFSLFPLSFFAFDLRFVCVNDGVDFSLFFIDITFGHFPTSPLLYHRHGCDACFFSDLVLICSSCKHFHLSSFRLIVFGRGILEK